MFICDTRLLVMFKFKQFEIDDSHCGMKLGTDGVLLGAWTPVVSGCGKVLDVGAGCGIISLMIAQRFPCCNITMVEIDDGAAEDARLNVEKSPWKDRIEVVCGDILDQSLLNERFDLVVSNPPFFNEALKAPDASRALARHGNGFDVIKLIEISQRLLAEDGLLAFIAPASRKSDIDLAAALAGLDRVALCDVRQRPSRSIVRQLHLFARSCRQRVDISLPAEITISDNHGYTDQYRQLTKDFYLKF